MISGLSEKIQKARIALGMNGKEFSKYIGIDESTLSRYENGEREPTLHNLSKLAVVLHVSSDFLLGIESNSTNTSPFIMDLTKLTSEQIQTMQLIKKAFEKLNKE